MKNNNKAMLTLWGFIILLAACSNLTPAPTATKATETATLSPTSTLDPFVPTPYPPPPDPNVNIIATPKPDQQVYTDPEGWYSVNFPAEMKPGKTANSFWSDRMGNFETGYLPEMGYVSNVTFVCAWLANIEFDPKKSVTSGASSGTECTASDDAYRLGGYFVTNYSIHENPGADPQHRFVYIKTTHTEKIETTFSWLKRVSKERLPIRSSPLRPQDAVFWQNLPPMPSGVSVTEYKLHSADVPLSPYIPEKAENIDNSDIYTPTPHRTTVEQLGYTKKIVPVKTQYKTPKPNTACDWCKTQLYRDGRLLFDNVYNISRVYTVSTDSGPINVFLVGIATDKNNFDNFLVENDAILVWDNGYSNNIDYYDLLQPRLYKDELIWLKLGSQKQVRKSNRDVIFSFVTYDELLMSQVSNLKKFISWNDHWILTFGSFLVQDGEFINKKLGYQEIFGWNLIDNKPAYFFNKGSRFGISYDGQVLPLQYEQIANGLCCWPDNNVVPPSLIYPHIAGDSAQFFGKRDGFWYYVVVKFK